MSVGCHWCGSICRLVVIGVAAYVGWLSVAMLCYLCLAKSRNRICHPCCHIYRYPHLLGKDLQQKLLPFATPIPDSRRYCCTWRGGGFRDECKEFFESMMGKCYRVPGFLATSIEYRTALKFIRRADKAHPRILWCILVRNALLAC